MRTSVAHAAKRSPSRPRTAQEALLDTTLLLVDRGTFKRFKKLFDAPAQPNDRLRALLCQKAPWEP
jgi:uncharacterized protein (DUF1778 family)